jgi:hypothetical protein
MKMPSRKVGHFHHLDSSCSETEIYCLALPATTENEPFVNSDEILFPNTSANEQLILFSAVSKVKADEAILFAKLTTLKRR